MVQVSVRTAVGFKGQTVAQLHIPEGADDCWMRDALEKLNKAGLTAFPGVREAHNQHVIRIYGKDPNINPAYTEANLKDDISNALAGDEVKFSGLFDGPPITPPGSDFGRWLQKNMPWAYEKAGLIAGSLMFTGASALMKSAFSTGDVVKEGEGNNPPKRQANVLGVLSALCFMASFSVVSLFVRQPKNPRHIYGVLGDLQNEIAGRPAEDLVKEAAGKDNFLTSVKENLRRFPWEVSSLISIPANALLVLGSMTKGSREKSDLWWTKSLVGLSMIGTHMLRVLVPQNGGKTLLSKFPATRNLAEKLGLDNLHRDSELSKNPVNFTSNMSLAVKVAGTVAGNITGDKGFAWAQPLSFAGMTFAKATTKAVGLGFDETITTAADFISKWQDAAISEDNKINWIAKKLAKQPEIFHDSEELVAGIRERLKQFELLKQSPMAVIKTPPMRNALPEKLQAETEKSEPKKKGKDAQDIIANEAMFSPPQVIAGM